MRLVGLRSRAPHHCRRNDALPCQVCLLTAGASTAAQDPPSWPSARRRRCSALRCRRMTQNGRQRCWRGSLQRRSRCHTRRWPPLQPGAPRAGPLTPLPAPERRRAPPLAAALAASLQAAVGWAAPPLLLEAGQALPRWLQPCEAARAPSWAEAPPRQCREAPLPFSSSHGHDVLLLICRAARRAPFWSWLQLQYLAPLRPRKRTLLRALCAFTPVI